MCVDWNKSDLKDYANARREWLKTYSKTDEILYAMCNKWPDHSDFNATQAKVRTIGRVYATGLERKGKKDKSKGIYETIAKLFCENKAWLDRELQILRRFKQPRAASERILALHGRLVKLLKGQTKSKVNFRSFVSKYLHFHSPIVPIFDSRSSKTINRGDWYPWKEYRGRATILPMKKGYDPVYFKFFMQFLFYYSELQSNLQKLKHNSTVKEADYYLIEAYWY